MPEKILVSKSNGTLAVVDTAESGQSIILSPAALTESLLRTVESYSPRKVEALTLSSPIKAIGDSQGLAATKEAQGKLAGVRIDAEKARKDFTNPFLDSQRFIKEQFDLLVVGMIREEKRLNELVQSYAAEVERKRQAQIAEQQRQATEAARKAREAQDRIEALKAELKNPHPSEEDMIAEQLEEAIFDAEVAPLESPAPVEIAESVGKPVLDYVIDGEGTRHEHASIMAFAKLYPQFCKIEIRRAAVIEELNNGGCFGAEAGVIPCVPGLKIIERFKTSTKVTR